MVTLMGTSGASGAYFSIPVTARAPDFISLEFFVRLAQGKIAGTKMHQIL